MIAETIEVKGHVHIEMLRAHGLKEVYDFDNLVVTVGKTFIASRIVGAVQAVMNWMAVGTNPAAPAIGDTTLGTEVARVAFDSAGSSSGAGCTFSATFGPGVGTGALVEAGMFNAASAGTMLSHVSYPVVNKQAGDTMAITWTLTVT